MNLDHSILTLILLTPLAGAAVLVLIPEREGSKAHAIGALIVTVLTLVFTLHLPMHFNYAAHGFQFDMDHSWIPNPAIRYHVGVDGLSMWLMVLAGVLAPSGVLASWNTIQQRTRLFYVLFLLQQVAMLGIFIALDLFLYYGFWELSLVPMTILIATFGRTENRRRAAMKFFLYAFIPSAVLLVAMLWLYSKTMTFDLVTLQALAAQHAISTNSTALLLCSLAFLVAFAVKAPIFPLHGWLSEAVQEAPTAAVMVLAGKLGLYSILRFSFGIFPEQSRQVAPWLIALGAIGIAYGALLALVQKDLKKLARLLHPLARQLHSSSASSPSPSSASTAASSRSSTNPSSAPRSSSCSACSTSATAPTTCATTAASPPAIPGWSPSSSSPPSRPSVCPCSPASSASS